MGSVSSQNTRLILDDDRVLSTSSVRVDCIVANNTHGSNNYNVIVRDNDSNVILLVPVVAGSSFVLDGSWMADNGLQFDSADSSVAVTVFHSAIGA